MRTAIVLQRRRLGAVQSQRYGTWHAQLLAVVYESVTILDNINTPFI
jgi:hypothetical protein